MPLENSVFRSTLPGQKGSEFHFVRQVAARIYVFLLGGKKENACTVLVKDSRQKIFTYLPAIEKHNFNSSINLQVKGTWRV